ncbi:MAG: hypothetical protein RL621_2282 [Bacteroidota bacterium]|jgi:hypothetical protein
MATILDLYNKNKTLSQREGGPDASVIDAKKFGTKGTPGVGFSSGDQTPYSVGTNIGGGKAADIAAIDAVANGNRYGIPGENIGGGITEYKTILGPAGVGTLPRESWNDTKKYGGINREG